MQINTEQIRKRMYPYCNCSALAVEDSPIKIKKTIDSSIDMTILDNVKCTCCGRQLDLYKSNSLRKHPELDVVICKHCHRFLCSGGISKDKDGNDGQCRWCGGPSRILICEEDGCGRAFCKGCIIYNFGKFEYSKINSQPKWKCYFCEKNPLVGLQEKYRKIEDTLKAIQESPHSEGTVSKSNNKTEDDDKEIDKLSKLPTLKKRKAKDMPEEGESKDDSKI
ncbi:unnamed protein product [Lymnaea stagnalis]|uniref:PHD-type domain-containing protein n=1 Tax=Lymnaea stagnalis TaxID=6523 RepID=A0AAV2HHB6_LYMST